MEEIKVNVLYILLLCSDAGLSNDYATLYVRRGHRWPSKEVKPLLISVMYLLIYAYIKILLHEILYNILQFFLNYLLS